MAAVVGRPLAEVGPAERIRTYAEVAVRGADCRAEYAILTQAAYRPSLSGPWLERMTRWFDLPDGSTRGPGRP